MFSKIIPILLATAAFCEEPELDVAKVSEAMGHLIGRNLQDLGLSIDLTAVVKGIQDEADGKNSPLSEDECVQAISSLQEETLTLESEKNLQEADAFLTQNRSQEDVVSLEEGKLQYKIVKEGCGETVQTYNSPLIRFSGHYLNGGSLGSNEGDELISLDEAIPGFSKGVIGMKEGEVRTLYVHPDLGYGKRGGSTPNSLLIFEVEVVKADASGEAHAASNSEDLPLIRAR